MKYLEKKNKDKISNFSQKNLKYLFYKVQKDLKCLNVKEKQFFVLNQDFYLKGDSLVKLENRLFAYSEAQWSKKVKNTPTLISSWVISQFF